MNDITRPIDLVLSKLEGVKKSGGQWVALCPAHDDQKRSLSIGNGRDRCVVLKCHAGCKTEDVVKAMGLEMKDLFVARQEGSRIENTYDYLDEKGKLLFQTVRFSGKEFRQRRPDGAGGWYWNLKGMKRVLYRLPELLGSDDEWVFVCEGEKSTESIRSLGLTATTSPMGAGKWKAQYAHALEGRRVCILPDNDEQGIEHAKDITRTIPTATTLVLPGLGNKEDPFDWVTRGGTRDELLRLAVSAQTEAPVGESVVPTPSSDSDLDRMTKANSLLHHTDQGNSERMAALYGRYLRYCPLWSRWLVWDGRRWKENDLLQVEALAKRTAATIWMEAGWCPEGDVRDAAISWARRSESRRSRMAMMQDTRSEPGIPVLPTDLDSDGWLLNVLNGTLDLRTGVLKDHDPDDLITKLIGVEYDPDAKCPEWDKFLNYFLAGDKEMIAFLQRAVGLSLTGQVRKAFFIISGGGDNGKSTFVEAIRGMMGEYAIKTPTSTLTTQRYSSIPNDIARLKGARFIYASELDRGSKLSEAFVKAWTGQTVMTARFMRAEWFDFMPEGKIWLDTNHKPEVKGTDNAIWNRLKIVEFNVVIPKSEQDEDFGDNILAQEYPGILAWAVRGCLDWQAQKLNEPGKVLDATKSYRQEMDVLQQFINECCYVGAVAKVSKGDLFDAYTKWGGTLTKYVLGREMRAHGFEDERLPGGAKAWRGVGLTARE